jgi:hypothetical protein
MSEIRPKRPSVRLDAKAYRELCKEAARADGNSSAGRGLTRVTFRASASILDLRKAKTTKRSLPSALAAARGTGSSFLAFWA